MYKKYVRPWFYITRVQSLVGNSVPNAHPFVRSLVCFVRPSVRRFAGTKLPPLSLPSPARSLVALVLFLSLARLARPHLLYFLLLSCFGCYGFVSVSGARLLMSILFFFSFWSRTFFFRVFWRNFRNPSNSAAAAAFVFVRGFCCLHVHVSSVWLSIVGDAFISLSQLALCCTCCCKRKNSDGFRLCFFLFAVEFALQQLDGNSSASHCGVWYSKIIATTTAALVLDTESEREKKALYHRLSFLLPSFAGTDSNLLYLWPHWNCVHLETNLLRISFPSFFLPTFQACQAIGNLS